MTPKHKAILASLPVAVRAAAQAYYDELDVYEKELSEFTRAQTMMQNANSRLIRAANLVQSSMLTRRKGRLYIHLRTGRYLEGTDNQYYYLRLKNDGHAYEKNAKAWAHGPIVELAPDDPFREKRRVALICNKLEGKQP